MDPATLALALGFTLSFLMAIALGGNDAATPCDTAVGAKVLTIRQAVTLFAIFVCIGALTQGFMVMKTIGRGIVPAIDLLGVIVIITSAIAWILFCNIYGLEISVTHSIVGAVIGYGLAAYGADGIRWPLVQKVMISWLTSPLLAALLSFLTYKLLVMIITRSNGVSKLMPTVLKIGLCYSAFAFGTNDIANSTGVYITVAGIVFGEIPEYSMMLILAAIGSIGIVIGGFLLGPRVIQTVAFKITRLNPVAGVAAETSNALVVHLFTTIPYMLFGYGIPISTSLAGVGALVGVGLSMYRSAGINKKTLSLLFSAWVATIVVTATATYLLYSALLPVTGPIFKAKP